MYPTGAGENRCPRLRPPAGGLEGHGKTHRAAVRRRDEVGQQRTDVSFSVGGRPRGTAGPNDAGIATCAASTSRPYPAGTRPGVVSASLPNPVEYARSGPRARTCLARADRTVRRVRRPPRRPPYGSRIRVAATGDSGTPSSSELGNLHSVRLRRAHHRGWYVHDHRKQGGRRTSRRTLRSPRSFTVAPATPRRFKVAGSGGSVLVATARPRRHSPAA